jgi:acid phosphatase type 7
VTRRLGVPAGLAVVVALIASAAAPAASPARVATLLAAGDISSCSSDGDSLTAALLARNPGTVAALGDLAYDASTREQLTQCYAPTWGRFLPRTRAALGNHEYESGSAEPAIAYFHLPHDGWYSYTLGTWHVIVLNSNCDEVGGCHEGSRQWGWLRANLASHRARCTLAYWHHPRWSSGRHGDKAELDPLWRLLARAHADVVLTGHDHDYERFAPIDGIRQFVVGTGGKSHYDLPSVRRPSSVAGNDRTYGVLRLTLRPDRYAWRFLNVPGTTFSDSGSGRCG